MSRRLCLILALVSSLHASAIDPTAAIKIKAQAKFFYSIPEEAESEWAYRIPDCSQLTAEQSKSILKCEKMSGHELCRTKLKVKLSDASGTKTEEFNVLYHVFASADQCRRDRESTLSGD